MPEVKISAQSMIDALRQSRDDAIEAHAVAVSKKDEVIAELKKQLAAANDQIANLTPPPTAPTIDALEG